MQVCRLLMSQQHALWISGMDLLSILYAPSHRDTTCTSCRSNLSHPVTVYSYWYDPTGKKWAIPMSATLKAEPLRQTGSPPCKEVVVHTIITQVMAKWHMSFMSFTKVTMNNEKLTLRNTNGRFDSMVGGLTPRWSSVMVGNPRAALHVKLLTTIIFPLGNPTSIQQPQSLHTTIKSNESSTRHTLHTCPIHTLTLSPVLQASERKVKRERKTVKEWQRN